MINLEMSPADQIIWNHRYHSRRDVPKDSISWKAMMWANRSLRETLATTQTVEDIVTMLRTTPAYLSDAKVTVAHKNGLIYLHAHCSVWGNHRSLCQYLGEADFATIKQSLLDQLEDVKGYTTNPCTMHVCDAILGGLDEMPETDRLFMFDYPVGNNISRPHIGVIMQVGGKYVLMTNLNSEAVVERNMYNPAKILDPKVLRAYTYL